MFRRPGQPKPPAMPVNRTLTEQRAHLAREIVETLLFVGLVFLIVHVTVAAYRVSDESMSPQLSVGQSVLVNKAAYLFGGPSRGDVVIYQPGCDLSRTLIGRVIAIPGDTVTMTTTSTLVNGITLDELYVHVTAGQTENSTIVPPTKLGSNQYFIVDDNRVGTGGPPNNCAVDTDSRGFGPVERRNIVGKAVLVFWPLSQREWISNYSSVFNAIHQ